MAKEKYIRRVVVDAIRNSVLVKRVNGLRVVFDCEKTNESNPNVAKIEVYNLSETSRGIFEGKNTRVQLSVGYEGLLPEGIFRTGLSSSSSVETVFVGNITKVKHKLVGRDIVTSLELADGGNRFRNARFNKGYPPNVKLNFVIDELITELGLAKGPKLGVPVKNYANGLALYGLIRDHLDVLCKANNLEWSIQNETVQIIQKDTTILNSPILINSDTGMVGSPEKTKYGVEFACLLDPSLTPGKKIKIEGKFLDGFYKVRKVNQKGDTNSGDFLSKCEATK